MVGELVKALKSGRSHQTTPPEEVRTLKPVPGNLAATLPQGGHHDVLADITMSINNSSNGEQAAQPLQPAGPLPLP